MINLKNIAEKSKTTRRYAKIHQCLDIFPVLCYIISVRRKTMKKIIPVFLCLLVIFVSCDISVPQTITIKGNPGVFVPMGSPFDAMEGDRIEDMLSPAKMKAMMGGSGVEIIEYINPATDVMSFLVHYPITEMKLDLQAQISESMASSETEYNITIPNTSGLSFGGNSYYLLNDGLSETENLTKPVFTIDLGAMATLLDKVQGGTGRFGIKIKTAGTLGLNNLRVYIENFGFSGYLQGNGDAEPGYLRFTNDTALNDPNAFKPKDVKELKIHIKIIEACSGPIIPEIIFDFESAVVKVDNSIEEGLKGSNPINNDFGDLLGGAKFKSIEGFIYVGGLGNNAKLTLETETDEAGKDYLKVGSTSIHKTALQSKSRLIINDPFTSTLPEHSLSGGFINMAPLFDSPGTTNLLYEIDVGTFTIPDPSLGDTIFADLIIVLNMELEVKKETIPEYQVKYVNLDMGMDDLFSGSGSDLFGRTPGSDDDLFSNIDSVKINIENFNINIFDEDKLAILVTSGTYIDYINFTDKRYLEMNMDKLPNPFTPEFKILLEKDTGKNYATFAIKRPAAGQTPSFDFTLSVEAKADLNIKIEL